MWLYADADPRRGIRDAIELARSEGILLPVLWIDVETYTDGTIPSALTIAAAIDECELLGVQPGIYTSSAMWQRIANPNFSHLPLWVAHYYFEPRPNLEGVQLFGGWSRDMVYGHQWTSSPVDQSVFLAKATLAS